MMNIANAEWFNDNATRKVIDQFRIHGFGNQARFVGGCVRNTLMSKEINDIDIATSLTPDQVISIFRPEFNVIETGLKHGTVTVVVDSVPFEITTLRRDVATDGRHAEVEFTQDWEVDASRRDFTVNGLYADFDGNIHDYIGGMHDIERGVIRFIGSAKDRIEEDYLRILRLFRFHAWYGKTYMEYEGRAWAGLLRNGLDQISRERISAELLKLFAAPNKAMMTSAVRDMHNCGILDRIIPYYNGLSKFYPLEKMDADPILFLGSMLPNYVAHVEEAARILKLSGHQINRLKSMPITDGRALLDTSDASIRRNTYTLSAQTYTDQLKLIWSRKRMENEYANNKHVVEKAFAFEANRPIMPVSGQDLIDAGMQPGKEVGQRLKEIEIAWINSDFTLTKEELI